jgi:hypothetical protein
MTKKVVVCCRAFFVLQHINAAEANATSHHLQLNVSRWTNSAGYSSVSHWITAPGGTGVLPLNCMQSRRGEQGVGDARLFMRRSQPREQHDDVNVITQPC